MATGGKPAGNQEKTFKLPCGISLTVSRCDIFKTDAEALVTGEDTKFRGQGMISKTLLQHCSQQYKKAREGVVKNHKEQIKVGSVHVLSFSGDGRGRMRFRNVYHTIVPRQDMMISKWGWRKEMKKMYFNLLKEADLHKTRSLALPLLGSGGAGSSHDDATDVFAKAFTSFRFKDGRPGNLRNVTLHLPGEEVFNSMVNRLAADISTTGGNDKRVRVHKVEKGVRSCFAATETKDREYGVEESNLTHILNGTTPSFREDPELVDEATEDYYFSCPSSDEEREDDRVTEKEVRESGEEEEEENCARSGEEEEEENCAICLDTLEEPKKLEKCGHTFCRPCIEDTFKHHKPACPTCNTLYGVITGNQPLSANMSISREPSRLPGYENFGTLVIDYNIPSGIQGKEHSKPGQPYSGTMRRAFLPDCEEGRKVSRLLVVAFEKRLIFTVGKSNTTGRDNVVTWNDIHHKTNVTGGSTGFGYPDPHYLSRVQEELAAKGVTEESLEGRKFDF